MKLTTKHYAAIILALIGAYFLFFYTSTCSWYDIFCKGRVFALNILGIILIAVALLMYFVTKANIKYIIIGTIALILVFTPDPLDAVMGLGTILEAGVAAYMYYLGFIKQIGGK